MEVYIVFKYETVFESAGIVACFDTEEKAQEFIKAKPWRKNYTIETLKINESEEYT